MICFCLWGDIPFHRRCSSREPCKCSTLTFAFASDDVVFGPQWSEDIRSASSVKIHASIIPHMRGTLDLHEQLKRHKHQDQEKDDKVRALVFRRVEADSKHRPCHSFLMMFSKERVFCTQSDKDSHLHVFHGCSHKIHYASLVCLQRLIAKVICFLHAVILDQLFLRYESKRTTQCLVHNQCFVTSHLVQIFN